MDCRVNAAGIPQSGNSPGVPPLASEIRTRAWPLDGYQDIYYPDGCRVGTY